MRDSSKPMQVEVLTTLNELRQIEPEWRRLPLPSPMQSPAWLISWWEAYGEDDPRQGLAVLAIRDGNGDGGAGELVGLAPWRVQRRKLVGPTLRLLGDGRASTDHQTILTRSPEDEPAVVTAAARWAADGAGDVWRRIRFEALDADDRAMNHLERLLGEAGLDTERVDDLGSFPAEMVGEASGATWDGYLATLSKNRRKRLRRWQREWFDSGRAVVRVAQTGADRQELWPLLVRLHRERREAMGATGVFDEPRFDRFGRLASERLLAEGGLYLASLELDGEPAAIEYALQDNDAVYAYQGGIAPAALERDAGHLSVFAMARTALATGRRRLDLLRGDEPYKLSWGATHRAASTLHVRPRDAAGRLERLAGNAYRGWRDRRQPTPA